jgi:predicted Zn-dependent protease
MERILKLKTFIQKDPEDLFSRHALAMELLKLGEQQEAIQVMEELLKIDYKHTGTYLHLGRTYEKTGDVNQALSTYKRGLEVCRSVNTRHDLQELMAAYQQLEEELDG